MLLYSLAITMDTLILEDSIIINKKYLQKDFVHKNVHVKVFPGYNTFRLHALLLPVPESLVRGEDPSDLRLDQDLMHDHLIHCLENDKFTMFPCSMYPSNVCMSSERVLIEVELYWECCMLELIESYFRFPIGEMNACTRVVS